MRKTSRQRNLLLLEFRNDMLYCWYSRRKDQYKDFRISLRKDSGSYWWKQNTLVDQVVTSNTDLMPLFVFPRGLRFNTEDYIKCLEVVVLVWIEKVATRSPYFWQQGYPSSNSSRRLYWLSENFCNHITADINPQIAISLIIICKNHWARDSQNSAKHQRWTEGYGNGSIYQFKHGDNR